MKAAAYGFLALGLALEILGSRTHHVALTVLAFVMICGAIPLLVLDGQRRGLERLHNPQGASEVEDPLHLSATRAKIAIVALNLVNASLWVWVGVTHSTQRLGLLLPWTCISMVALVVILAFEGMQRKLHSKDAVE